MGKNLPTVRVGDKDVTVTQMLATRATQIDEILPEASGMTGEQLARIAQMEVLKNPTLAECRPGSIMNSVYDAARLGLLIGREAHLVPYKGTCKMIPDYRGFITLVYRSGLVSLIDAKCVFPEDDFDVDEGTVMTIHHKPDYSIDRELGENILYVYAEAWLHGAPKAVFHVMNRMAIDKIRDCSAMKDGEPWTKWYDRQAQKSALKYLTDKRLPATQIRGMADLLELDTRAEIGKMSRPTSWEDKEDIEEQIDQETKARSEELKMALSEARQRTIGEEDEAP